MKKLIFSLLMVFVASVAVNKVNAQIESGAKVEFMKETHDYGTIKYGADGSCTFEFKNTGNAPLIISNAKGSCGCTVPVWPKEPIAPGASDVIEVTFSPKPSQKNEIKKTVTVTANTKEKVHKLEIRAFVKE